MPDLMPGSVNNEHIRQLLHRYLESTATPDEKAELFEYLASNKEDEAWIDMMEKMMTTESGMKDYEPSKWQPIIEELKKQNAEKDVATTARVRRITLLKRTASWAAAAILLIVAGYFVFNREEMTSLALNPSKADTAIHDLPPGTNKAILTKADGTRIILDNAANGTLTKEGNAKIVKLSDGQVTYITDGEKNADIVYNTMSTPRGGQYRLTLPDGTEVWLNAASSITYPTSFNGKERNVSITGEAYFEVAKDATKPFHVKVNDMTVEVLGTHFNINAYADEPVVKTTLLEGSVRVSSPSSNGLLKPGQQAHKHKDGNIALINGANTEEAVAWKNGGFYFDGADISTIMRQVERWYNVKVVYKGEMPHGHYKGQPSRNLPLAKMLEVFKYSGLKFDIEGNTMTVFE